jgi:pentatricopeptide repeat protein
LIAEAGTAEGIPLSSDHYAALISGNLSAGRWNEAYAWFNRMKARGNIKTISGGYEIAEPISYAENSTYQRYAGYDALNTNASDVLTTVKYPLRQVALHVTASGREIRMNSSKEAMKNLVRARKENAMDTATNQFAIDLYSSGALSEQVNGLQNLIQTNGQGTVGGIDSVGGISASGFRGIFPGFLIVG